MTAAESEEYGGPLQKGGSLRQLVDNRWAVLAVLFLVLAGFGLPILWTSKAFSPLGKALLTIIVLAYTALILWLIYIMVLWLVAQLSQIRGNLA